MFHSAYVAVQKYFRHGPWYLTNCKNVAFDVMLSITVFYTVLKSIDGRM